MKDQKLYKNGFDIQFLLIGHHKFNPSIWSRYKFICFNKEQLSPVSCMVDYHSDGYDGCALFYFNGKEWIFRLYSDYELVNCSYIANMYGGSGYNKYAEFKISNIEDLNKILNSTK